MEIIKKETALSCARDAEKLIELINSRIMEAALKGENKITIGKFGTMTDEKRQLDKGYDLYMSMLKSAGYQVNWLQSIVEIIFEDEQ